MSGDRTIRLRLSRRRWAAHGNVPDLFTLTPASEHPHGLSERGFDSLFTVNRPVIFNFHGYTWLGHRLAHRRTNHVNLHVCGYKEKGSINTPFELAIVNQSDYLAHAHRHSTERADITDWAWPDFELEPSAGA